MSNSSAITTIPIPEGVDPVGVCGIGDASLRALEDNLPGIEVWARSNQIMLAGPPLLQAVASDLVAEMIAEAGRGDPLTPETVAHAASLVNSAASGREGPVAGLSEWEVLRARDGIIRAKTQGQKDYVDAIASYDVIFGIGPAGTGKTYLAMAKAVGALMSGEVKRIILTRPAVEAGENLGFLPGSLTDKIDPYLRPLYDALRDMIDPAELTQLIDAGAIEVAPLAYMRGRTLNDAFIVLDEAQNTTSQQMKMFLTRLGFRSTMVVTGDISQIDLPAGRTSGLTHVRRILDGVEGIAFVYLTSADVVRNELVGRIIDAYDAADARQARLQAHRRVTRGRAR
ncbi:PhoH family protein [Nanchangia anserum]|uniref:PhoH-like protein n=1 Tax=Nanchangia anserum TaxID=2692125 RepID=A0A8I0KNB0_9ACTO|nr:PhoH family protein [Nanchangia anserum]MBD3689091.1 PhoH family protein [Nanchangia anserum]QOX81329.1 PhoH family protein [Nanchangia anserum]